jgi:hypothetical protein
MRIIAYAIDKKTGIYTSDGRHISEPPYLDAIINDSGADTIQVFGSLDADIAGLLPLIQCSHKELETLSETERLSIPPYRLTYFPQKFFGIDKGGGWGHPFSNISDMAQHDVSLDKIEDNHTPEYWFGKAKKAYEIAMKAYNVYTELGLHPKNSIISPKSVYEEEFVKLDLPTLHDIPPEVAELSYNACMGNWVECFKRGRFEHTTDFDISSAYPHWASKLLDLRYGEWVHSSEYQPQAYYGYVDVEVNVDKQFSPVLWKDKDQNNYTFTGVNRICTTKNMLDYITHFNLGYYTIVDGWWWKPTKIVRPLQQKLNELYALKSGSTGMKKEIVKRIMTGSFYGNFIQTVGGKEGKHMLPPYAAEIETNTRLQVASFVEENKLSDRLLVVAVDGVLVDGKVESIVDKRTGIGSWRKSYEGEAIVVHSGLNCIDGKFGEGDFSLSLPELKEMFASNPEANSWVMQKPSIKTLGVAMNENNLDAVGDIIPTSKTVFLEEFKREYTKKPKTGNDLLTKTYNSRAWGIGTLKAVTESADDELDNEEDNDNA